MHDKIRWNWGSFHFLMGFWLNWLNSLASFVRLPVDILDRVRLFLVSSDRYCSPKWDLNLGASRIPVFKVCKANALTTKPPWLDYENGYFSKILMLQKPVTKIASFIHKFCHIFLAPPPPPTPFHRVSLFNNSPSGESDSFKLLISGLVESFCMPFFVALYLLMMNMSQHFSGRSNVRNIYRQSPIQ